MHRLSFGALLPPLGRCWVPFRTELEPKGIPKTVFEHHVGTMMKKGYPKRDPKKNQTLIDTCTKMKGLGCENIRIALYVLQHSSLRGVIKHKIDAKRVPNNNQNESQNHSEIIFLDFGSFWEDPKFRRFWEAFEGPAGEVVLFWAAACETQLPLGR